MSARGDARLTLFGLSGLVGATAANDVLFSFHNPAADFVYRLDRLDVEARVVTGYAAAQEVALAAHFVTDQAVYTGGTSLSSTPAFYHSDLPINAAYSYTEGDPGFSHLKDNTNTARIATTGALAASGVPVINAQPFAWDGVSALATSATTPKDLLSFSYRPGRNRGQLIGEDAGFIIRTPIALVGTGGATLRFFVRALLSERQLK